MKRSWQRPTTSDGNLGSPDSCAERAKTPFYISKMPTPDTLFSCSYSSHSLLPPRSPHSHQHELIRIRSLHHYGEWQVPSVFLVQRWELSARDFILKCIGVSSWKHARESWGSSVGPLVCSGSFAVWACFSFSVTVLITAGKRYDSSTGFYFFLG